MNLDSEAEELASALGADKTEVKRDLENLVSYSVPLEEAKQSLRRKYGDGDDSSGSEPESKDLADVTPEDSNVTVTGRVLTVGKRSIRYQGADHTIYEGEIADETGTLSYTAWENFDLEPGDTIRAGNAGVREWEGSAELNLGESTSVEKREQSLSVPYEIGGDAALIDLEAGDRGVAVEVTVLECERKVIDGRDGETEILSGVLADETARLPFTDWDPHPEIEEGASIRIENTYVREFRGAPSINVSEFSTVEVLDRTVEAAESAPELSIREALDSGGMFDVEVRGDVIAVRDGSGLIERCPECGRIVQNGQCRTHGQVEPVEDLRTKAILDDGTGTVTAILDDELTAEIYGGDVEDAREHARDAMDKEVVADTIREAIVGRSFRVRGTLSIDEYGANLNATAFSEVADDPAGRAAALLAEVNP
ncbi:Single-stranded DNA binding protein [Halapricum desulfuricans]|uniref:Single-stranded DNA-binding replication protein A (RPA), large (70 kD) subunit or related ssDNA-binding protein n=1 Tax=Halapricum desulfuricans TaxID=2841257 RepID=A0A897MZ91_9EURY|nr:Single-stranded DNA binding protein [Halapricum desulfuricans]QSG05601.1 Single-stranded DNA-binding replication protein A (RPA), large (70 kD) subunit or related ssDNA-binding protein [Halapricum desulfuricans]